MRPIRLDMAGFTVFREETTVDFTDADFFALVGPTGSGKSTVLDAICFALYGTVPRWGGTRGLANALAPSTTEARVRLVFESAGDRYVATRVVRRDGRGAVKTANAGLQLMPAGFDVTKLDTGLSPDDLGEVIAGTPAEMEDAVLEAVGLPYEQFTSCVVLPQGQFADFLHAKPATRQQILINLLGLGVYEDVQKRATERAGQAEAKLEAVDRMLGGLAADDDETLAGAEERADRMRELAGAVAAAVPELERARATARDVAAALAGLDAELAVLAGVRAPDGIAELARAVTTARTAADEAAAAVALAEEREEKLRGELAAAGDESALRLLLKAHADRERLTAEADAVRAAVAAAQGEHEAAARALAEARTAAERADAELETAFRAHEEAKATDQAVALRAHLVDGAPCPVCEQVVPRVPAVPAGSAVARATAAGKAAR
ncbi:SMC family ATPase, partial [Micromonospora sp. RTP1Z1]|uniref:SMC family ATPase n=1 Tax=Micromonospora sp. RTP1Z1 TaxID=2994043 RepID=UPI0029C6712B